MIYCLLLFFVFGKSQKALSQESSFLMHANLPALNSTPHASVYDFNPQLVYFDGLSFAYRVITKRQFMHQFDAKLQIQKSDKDNRIYDRLSMHYRYDFGKFLKHPENSRGKFLYGCSLKYYFMKEDIKDEAYSFFPAERVQSGYGIYATGQYEYSISRRGFISVGLSFLLLDMHVESQYLDNPILSEAQKKSTTFNIERFNEIILRVGAGYKFSLPPATN
jgi:hypothetical protein